MPLSPVSTLAVGDVVCAAVSGFAVSDEVSSTDGVVVVVEVDDVELISVRSGSFAVCAAWLKGLVVVVPFSVVVFVSELRLLNAVKLLSVAMLF